jgi:hypothetical protein
MIPIIVVWVYPRIRRHPRCRVSVIMWTGGAFKNASSFQIGVLLGRRLASNGMLTLASRRWNLIGADRQRRATRPLYAVAI